MKKILKSVPFRWFLSYLVIFVIAISAGVGISAYGRNLVEDQTSQIYESMLRQMQIDMDAYIRDVYRVYVRLARNNDVERVFSQLTETTHYDDYKATHSLLGYLVDNTSLEDIFVYNSNTGKVISCTGHMDMDYFYDLYYANSGVQLEDLQAYLTNQNLREYMVIHGENQSRIFFSHNVLYTSAGSGPINACVVLNVSKLTERMENSRWDNGLSLAVIDDNGTVTFTGEEAIPPSLLSQAAGSEYAQISDHTGALFVQTSSVVPWQYVVYAPASLFTSITSRLTLITFVVMVICATLCVFLTLFFVRGNYRPLRETISILSSARSPGVKEQAGTTNNEFLWLQETARLYAEEMDQNQNALQVYHRRLRSQLLLRLLETPFDLRRDPPEMETAGLEFHRSHFHVIHFYFDDSQALLLSNNIEKGRGALGFAIINVFGELMGSEYHIEALDMVGRVSVVMNFSANDAFDEKLHEAVFTAQEYIGNKLGAVVHCAAGAVHPGTEGIYLSSKEATEAAAYLSADGTEGVVFYDDVKNLLNGYEYPLELEYQLLDSLTTCNGEAAVKYLRQVFNLNETVVGEMRRCMLIDLSGTIIKAAGMVGNPSLAARIELAEVTTPGGEKQLEEYAWQFCERLAAERKDNSGTNRLNKRVRCYVEENFSDPELNVSRIGKHFNMTPAYLSSLFREETGLSLLEYITTCRIRRAKELLKTGNNIQEISLLSGFRNSGAFIRVFKRVEGITPGQWVERQ